MKKLLLLLVIFVFCCCKDLQPNIRTEKGIEYCPLACAKMQSLYNKGDESCHPYIEVIIVDGKEMNCTQFCEYSHKNSINLNPKCIYDEITICENIIDKCK